MISYRFIFSLNQSKFVFNIYFYCITFSTISKNVFGLFIKPRIQERGKESGERGKRGECSLGFRGIS